MESLTISRVVDDADIRGIVYLHTQNHKNNLTQTEMDQEGFVTAEYDFASLKRMNDICPSIIAKNGNEVVGYALVVTRQFYGSNPLLDDLFDSVDAIIFNNELLGEANYVMVGQLCVAKEYRGLGIVQQMYTHFKNELSGAYKFCITDVASNNPRSVKAHIKSGFQIIKSKTYNGMTFDVVLWDWKNSP